MQIIYKNGNVVDALLNGEVDFVAHCCNAQGVMGSGVAKEIKERIPDAYEVYRKGYESYRKHNFNFLGSCWHGGKVFNLVGQEFYGTDKKRYVNYGALSSAIFSVRVSIDYLFSDTIHEPVLGIPYKMASDRAGGDWDVVLELLEYLLPSNTTLVVYKLEK